MDVPETGKAYVMLPASQCSDLENHNDSNFNGVAAMTQRLLRNMISLPTKSID